MSCFLLLLKCRFTFILNIEHFEMLIILLCDIRELIYESENLMA